MARSKRLMKEISKLLKNLEDIPRFKNENEIEFFVLGVLRGKYGNKKEVKRQVNAYSKGKVVKVDIAVEDDLAIEIKFPKNTADFERAIGQIKKYAERFPYRILLVYDPHGRSFDLSGDDDRLKDVELVVWK